MERKSSQLRALISNYPSLFPNKHTFAERRPPPCGGSCDRKIAFEWQRKWATFYRRFYFWRGYPRRVDELVKNRRADMEFPVIAPDADIPSILMAISYRCENCVNEITDFRTIEWSKKTRENDFWKLAITTSVKGSHRFLFLFVLSTKHLIVWRNFRNSNWKNRR